MSAVRSGFLRLADRLRVLVGIVLLVRARADALRVDLHELDRGGVVEDELNAWAWLCLRGRL
eukprot:15021774-Heterocapsa_arctica.AAC.1